MPAIAALYNRLILKQPRLVLVVVVFLTAVMAVFVSGFELDASADSLLMEQDPELRYYNSVMARYGSENFLVITYTARQDLLSQESRARLQKLRDELLAVEHVTEVVSILDVPLIDSPRTTLSAIQKHVPTLEDGTADPQMARRELRESPIYSNLLMSLDGKTTALLVRFKANDEYLGLQRERDRLREKMLITTLEPDESAAKDQMSRRMKDLRLGMVEREKAGIATIREILALYKPFADIHLGGVPMIVSDMMDYIRHDIVVFGLGILLFLVVLLTLIFGRPRWVVIAMLCCLSSAVMMVGFLGLTQWRVTVVSSNFVALMLIFSLSLTVHLIQRYRELHVQNPRADQYWLVGTALLDKAKPCVFTAITTMVGFGSLLVSGIKPVIDFGWMMVIGMVLVLFSAFTLFPACSMLLTPGKARDHGDSTQLVTGFFATLVDRRPLSTLFACLFLGVLGLWGISQLQVENRFIDYFKKDTEIYQGMLTIDRKLGGTVPLEVILDADSDFLTRQSEPEGESFGDDAGAIDDFDDFDDDFAAEASDEIDLGATSYWYNTFRLARLREVHDYLDSLPETGKVLSMATTLETLEILNQDETPGTFFLSVLYQRLPESIKSALFDPYMSDDGNQVRISMRIYESDPDLQRDRLITDIRRSLVERFGFEPQSVHVTGMLVLYNNVLQSLYKSQILTLGVVFVAITLMFALLFWSIKIALIAIVPSMLSVSVVLGSMGLAGIPLDIMTITIAAISVGIGVDDSIHYIHRYRQEIGRCGDAVMAMHRSHASVGRAMFYTSVIIVAGFGILALSNFIPSILFGLLTGLAMVMALVANLTLLPLLLRWGRVR